MDKHTAYLEQVPGKPLQEHVLAAWQGFAWDNYKVKVVEPTYFDDFLHDRKERFQADKGAWFYRKENPVVGSVEFVRSALRYFGAKVPAPLNVPIALQDFSHGMFGFAGRHIQQMTIAQLYESWDENIRLRPEGMFVKPALEAKLWTGDVVTKKDSISLLTHRASSDTLCCVSSVVPIRSEYRVFVNRDRKIVDVRFYAGDPFVVPSKQRIEAMIAAYESAPSAYALDVYVTPDNQTFVMECNDFWALGTYGTDPITYSRMLAQRWHQLLS